MSKNKIDRKINRVAKKTNKILKTDVFSDRFWVRQVAKQRGNDGMQYYLYELCDRLEPERNSYFSNRWLWGGSHFLTSVFFEEVNDFIIKSDFWSKYWNDESKYDRKLDVYRNRGNYGL